MLQLLRSFLSILCLLGSFHALAKAQLQGLHARACGAKICFEAAGADAFVSQMENLIAAENVDLKILEKGESRSYSCASFTLHLSHQSLVCELRPGQANRAVLLDLSRDEVTYFK